MTKSEFKKKYPMLSLRIKPEQKEYLSRESAERKLSIADYVRAVLFPFILSDGKK